MFDERTLFVFTRPTDYEVIAVREGAIRVVLSVLKTHVSSESVCSMACYALSGLTVNAGVFDEHPLFIFTRTTTDNKVIAGREGAISVVLSVLNKHISSESVCYSACDALWNITFNAGVFDEHP